jgi:DNA-binding response OmpR family regulator
MTTQTVFAIVREKEEPVRVAVLTQKEYDEQGVFGLEVLARDYCDKRKLTFEAVTQGE